MVPGCKQWCFMENVDYLLVSIGVFGGECWYLMGK